MTRAHTPQLLDGYIPEAVRCAHQVGRHPRPRTEGADMQTTTIKGRDLRRGHVVIDYAGDRHYVVDIGPCDAETLAVTLKTDGTLPFGFDADVTVLTESVTA